MRWLKKWDKELANGGKLQKVWTIFSGVRKYANIENKTFTHKSVKALEVPLKELWYTVQKHENGEED